MTGVARRLRPIDWGVALALASAYVAVLVKTARSQGYARDEGFYFAAAESYAGWFEKLFLSPFAALQRSAVDAAFAHNHEHPALVKSLFSLSWMFLYKRFHLFSEEGTSFRFPGMCFAGLTLATLYLWGTEARGRRVGVAAALAFALVPTTFYHAHLDCFDVPIAAMWLLCAYCYWKSLAEGGVGWAIVVGVVYGLTLDTKHNSWFLPFAVIVHALIARGVGLRRDALVGRFRVPLALIAMLTIGPVVFVLSWPWLWFDTAHRFADYVAFHTGHEYYNMEFLGTTYWKPPFPRSYAWLMTAATLPVVSLAITAVGAFVLARERLADRDGIAPRDPAATVALWTLGVFVNYAPWLSPGTPIFGGTKHWLTAYPFLALFAGVGFDWVVRTLETRAPATLRRATLPVVAGACLGAPLVETWHSHPFGLSAYSPLVGGTPGAASLGLNRGFWGYQTGSLVGFLNAHLPPGGTLYLHDTAYDAFRMLQRDGRLRADIRPVMSPAYADAALYHHEQHMEGVEYQIWVAFGTTSPAEIVGLDGVPIAWVYLRPR